MAAPLPPPPLPQPPEMPVPSAIPGILLAPDMLKGAPAWAVELMNEQRMVRIELASMMAALMRRGLVTEQEINQARMAVTEAAQREFDAMVAQLGRQIAKKPTIHGKPVDPRRAP